MLDDVRALHREHVGWVTQAEHPVALPMKREDASCEVIESGNVLPAPTQQIAYESEWNDGLS